MRLCQLICGRRADRVGRRAELCACSVGLEPNCRAGTRIHSPDFGKEKQPDYIKQRQPPEFRRLALLAANELRFCRSCFGRQGNSCGRSIFRHPSRPVNSLSMLVSSSSANSSRRTRCGQESPRSHLRPPVVSRPYARQHGSASVPVGGVPRRCESRLAPDKSKYNHGSAYTPPVLETAYSPARRQCETASSAPGHDGVYASLLI